MVGPRFLCANIIFMTIDREEKMKLGRKALQDLIMLEMRLEWARGRKLSLSEAMDPDDPMGTDVITQRMMNPQAVSIADTLDDPRAAGFDYDASGDRVSEPYRGFSMFQSEVNEYLDGHGYEPGVWYFWDDEDTIIMLGSEKDADEILHTLDMAKDMGVHWASEMRPRKTMAREGRFGDAWAIELRAQMMQDPSY